MSKPRYRDRSANDRAIVGAPEFDAHDFIDKMEQSTELLWRPSDGRRPALRRIEDWIERRDLCRELDDGFDEDID